MKLNIREIAIFGMLGAVMYILKMLMEFLPNVHLLGAFVIALTVVYRAKALYPIYTYIFINGFFAGFAVWWIPYLYIWTVLWGATMLIPQDLNPKVKMVIYVFLCASHGFLFGTLYSVGQAILFGMDFKATVAWIIAGLPWDVVHGVGNLFAGLLINKLVKVIRLTEKLKIN
jgi:energy-coupling factor transport system substrate-specific component